MIDVPAHLRHFFLPQAEQLGLRPEHAQAGFFGYGDERLAQGALWSFALGPDCLVNAHIVIVKDNFVLEETPDTYACVCSTSPACLASVPCAQPAHARAADNLCTFATSAPRADFPLKANTAYSSCSICLTPDFPRRHPELWPLGFEELAHAFQLIEPNTHSSDLRWLLRLVDYTHAQNFQAARQAHACSQRIVALALREAAETLRAHEQLGCDSQKQLVRKAKRLVASNLDEPFSLKDLAENLFVSRSTLCAVFKQETGQALGTYLQNERVRAAQDLLAHSSLAVADIATRVGYRRQGSFAKAFKEHTSLTPSEWRRREKASAQGAPLEAAPSLR